MIKWDEECGYFVAITAYFRDLIPTTYDGWTDIFAFLTVAVTFFCITLPRAANFSFFKKDKNKDDK